jgi:hypothetical protein
MTRLAVSARPRIAALIAVLIAALPGGVALAQATLTAKAPDLVPIPSRMLQGTVSVRNAGAAVAGPSIVTVVCKKLDGGACAESRQWRGSRTRPIQMRLSWRFRR